MMTEICGWCGKEYIPHKEHSKKWQPVFNYCSDNCRHSIYEDMKRVKEILKGDWHNKTVGLIERLGFKVTVSKV